MEDVVVFTALAWEARSVLDGLQGVESVGVRRWRGHLGDGASALVLQLGVGQERAALAAERAPAARLFASVGCAGALAGGLHAGDVVVADRVIALDRDGRPAREAAIPAIGVAAWAAARGTPVRTGPVASSPVALAKARAKTRAGKGGALVVEMESAGVVTAAAARGIPCLVVKVVLDEAGDDLVFPGGDAIDPETGELMVGRAVVTLLPRPVYWPAVVRLARQQRLAERRLREFVGALFSAGLDGLLPRAGLVPAPGYAG